MIKVFAKIQGRLAVWEVEGDGYADAIALVRADIADSERANLSILAVVA